MQHFSNTVSSQRGWSGGAMALGKLPVPGRPTNLDKSRARPYCACRRCGGGCLDISSLVSYFFFLSPSLWETARYRLKYCLKGPLSQKQPTNQSLLRFSYFITPYDAQASSAFSALIFFYVFFCHFYYSANSILLPLLKFSYFINPYEAQASSAFSALI